MAHRPLVQRLGYGFLQVVCRLAAVVFLRIRCEGRRHIPKEGGVLVCSNHQSFLDPLLVGLACDRRLNALSRKTLFRFAPLRWLIKFLDAIPIDRDGLGLSGLRETLRRLRIGKMVLIFPEGTRTRDGRVAPLKPGFCTLVRRGKAAVVPVAIAGAFEVWPRWRAWPWPAVVRIQIGEPIMPAEAKMLSDRQLIERLEQAIRACYEEAQRQRMH